MKPIVVSVSFHLLLLGTLVFANLDQELRKSIDEVMKCKYHEPPKGPVMAVTPARFSQFVAILHQRFNTPSCGRAPKVPIKVNDRRTWPFCVFGKCFQGKCECAGGFTGPKCGTYTKKCWLMYCYLTSCHPAHQSLHCVCDPSLYGIQIVTGIYWYDEGKSSKYVPPPPGWEDDLGGMNIKLGNKDDPAVRMGAARPNQNVGRGSLVHSSGRGSLVHSPGQGSSVHSPGQVSSVHSPGQGSSVHSPGQGSSVHSPGQGSSVHSPAQGSLVPSPSHSSSVRSPAQGSPVHSSGRGSKKQGQSPVSLSGPKMAPANQKFNAEPNTVSGSRNRNKEGTGGYKKPAPAKSDIEAALNELEGLAPSMLKAFPIYLLLILVLSIQWLHGI